MNRPIRLIPPFKVNYIMMSLSETCNYGNKMHNVPEEWKVSKGEGVTVAVIDSGLPVHRDLTNQILDARNFTDSPLEDLVCGHSTHVCGIIAAEENGEGVIGIAPKSKILVGKALGDDGSGSDKSIADAIMWAADAGAQVINMSLGAPNDAQRYMPLTGAAVRYAYSKNIAIVCAAGNEDASKVGFPACLKETISVAAVDSKEQRASFSNRGSTLDFAAAGVDIVSTYKNNTYASLSGTSMACPQIAGICALLLSEHLKNADDKATPIKTSEDFREHLRKICVDLGPGGYDNEYGRGLPVFGHINATMPTVPPDVPNGRDEYLRYLEGFFKKYFPWYF